jgi:outer membrane protein
MPEYRVAQQTLQGAYQKSQQAVQNMTVGYQQKVDTYQQQQAMLTPDRRTAQEAELMQLQQEIQTMAAQQEQQLKDQELSLMIPIQEKVQVAINEIAVARGLDLIIRSPGLLYANDKTVTDITEELAIKLGISFEAPE